MNAVGPTAFDVWNGPAIAVSLCQSVVVVTTCACSKLEKIRSAMACSSPVRLCVPNI